eukprot:TRINITY_DN2188_c0_g1_i1.p1 TRINITY_DN2188_c0_g1~~TRINITY_DN2188_c0_g1_i1.p1  ORF type:complete len:237 (-),score=50.36 TRINITY_DN2188_c0_g1_i1:37-747(-)
MYTFLFSSGFAALTEEKQRFESTPVVSFFRSCQNFGWHGTKQWSPEWYLIDALIRRGNNFHGNEVVMPPTGRPSDILSVNKPQDAKKARDFYKNSTPLYMMVIGLDKKTDETEGQVLYVQMYPLSKQKQILIDPLSNSPFVRFFKRLPRFKLIGGKLTDTTSSEVISISENHLPASLLEILTTESVRVKEVLGIEMLGPYLECQLVNQKGINSVGLVKFQRVVSGFNSTLDAFIPN